VNGFQKNQTVVRLYFLYSFTAVIDSETGGFLPQLFTLPFSLFTQTNRSLTQIIKSSYPRISRMIRLTVRGPMRSASGRRAIASSA
jgi:hypothetical protein